MSESISRRSDPGQLARQAAALYGKGDLGGAERLLSFALGEDPSHAHSLHLMGVIAYTRGDVRRAVELLRQATSATDDAPEFHSNLAAALLAVGDHQGAATAANRAIALKQDFAEARNNHGLALRALGRITEAEAEYRRAVDLKSEFADPWSNLGNLLWANGRAEEAETACRRAIQIRPRFPEALINLGIVLRDQDRLEEAIDVYKRALSLRPNYAEAYNGIGSVLMRERKVGAAESAYRRALAAKPNFAEAHLNLAFCLLAQGRYLEAWPEYEWRIKVKELAAGQRAFAQPEWQGEQLGGKTLLIHAEQGMGDVIQFARFVNLAVERGARVVLEAHPPLVALLARLSGVAEVVPMRGALPEFAAHVRLLSLPNIFDIGLDRLAGDAAYIEPDPERVEAWRAIIGDDGRLRVGLVWSGNQGNRKLAHRNMPLEALRPLLAIDGVRLFSLQVGTPSAELSRLPRGAVDDLAPRLRDFADTAAAVANLDLIITVDTAVAHLAGALARPTWIMLPFVRDWRWLSEGEESPWYASVRLFQQPAPHHWEPVVARIAAELKELAAERPRARPVISDGASALAAGRYLAERGRHAEAAKAYAHALQLAPDDPMGAIGLASALREMGQPKEALAAIERALDTWPVSAPLHKLRGRIMRDLGRLLEAQSAFRRAASIDRADVEALVLAGMALKDRGEPESAIALYQEALTRNPKDAWAYNNLGNALQELGRFDAAQEAYEKAVGLVANYVEAHVNLGNVNQALGRLPEAEAAYRRAIAFRPTFAEGHNNLGTALRLMGRLEAAAHAYRRAIELKPTLAEAVSNLASVFNEQGRIVEAQAAFARACAINPDHAAAASNLLLAMNYATEPTRDAVFAAHRRWGERFAAKIEIPPHVNSRMVDRRLRIGYVSADFREHSVSYFFEPLLGAHDANRVETVCYSAVARPDETTRRLEGLAGAWRSLVGINDERAMHMVREDGIDILVDLGGHTARNRLPLFALKPAPVQVTWLGYPNTTGLAAIDYRLTDAVCDVEGDERWSTETLVRLPNGFHCYRPPADAPKVGRPPSRRAGHVTFGSFNNLTKVNPDVVAAWANILQAVPKSLLLLKSRALSDEPTRRRYFEMFERAGVEPARLRLLPWTDKKMHLAVYGEVDIALDPFPYNGTTTTCEALWMGVPVVALAGDRHAGRVSASILRRIGLDDLVASDQAGYVGLAARLASDAARLSDLRAGMRTRLEGSPLMDAKGFARDLEQAYREMWRAWCQSRPT
ncbi:MAG TPA: tetratricopeptide repeat protein [Alphaproteobacteria bacterium]|nr:tetratricopeptide repeat protein [Alphaproteobacteria bacterium]